LFFLFWDGSAVRACLGTRVWSFLFFCFGGKLKSSLVAGGVREADGLLLVARLELADPRAQAAVLGRQPEAVGLGVEEVVHVVDGLLLHGGVLLGRRRDLLGLLHLLLRLGLLGGLDLLRGLLHLLHLLLLRGRGGLRRGRRATAHSGLLGGHLRSEGSQSRRAVRGRRRRRRAGRRLGLGLGLRVVLRGRRAGVLLLELLAELLVGRLVLRADSLRHLQALGLLRALREPLRESGLAVLDEGDPRHGADGRLAGRSGRVLRLLLLLQGLADRTALALLAERRSELLIETELVREGQCGQSREDGVVGKGRHLEQLRTGEL
jgi:hypothetical protein